jgi:hypothetical protein
MMLLFHLADHQTAKPGKIQKTFLPEGVAEMKTPEEAGGRRLS